MFNLNEIIVRENETFEELIEKVNKAGSGVAIIVDQNDKFSSLMTDGDIRRAILAGTSLQTRLLHLASKSVVTGKDTAPEEEIAKLMDKKIRHIPILNEKGEVVDLAVSSKTPYSTSMSRVTYLTRSESAKNRIIQKVLLIGGGGYIGSVMARKLLEKRYEVKILDSFIYGSESVDEIKNHRHLEIVNGDTKHIGNVVRVMHDIDAIIHLAEVVGDPACSHDPLLTQETNLFATENIARICKHLKIARMIYASSCSVYGATKDPSEKLTETSPLCPVSLYAGMKIEAEKALLGMTDHCFQPTILRLGTVFGPSPRMRFDLVINLLSAKAITEKKIMILGGEQWRPFVHVEDVVDAFVLALESPSEDVGGKIFNVGGDDMNFQIRDLGTIFKNAFPDIEVVTKEKEEDKRNYRVDFTRIRNTLGFTPQRSIINGIHGIEQMFLSGKISDYTDTKYSNIKTMSLGPPKTPEAMR